MNIFAIAGQILGNQILGKKIVQEGGRIARKAKAFQKKLLKRYFRNQTAGRESINRLTRRSNLVGRRTVPAAKEISRTRIRNRVIRRATRRYSESYSRAYRKTHQKVVSSIKKHSLFRSELQSKRFNEWLTGRKGQSFGGYVSEFAKYELATMPMTAVMYQYDKSQYPELEETGFLKYYAETIPFTLSFGALSAATGRFRRRLTQRVKHQIHRKNLARPIAKGMLGAMHSTNLIARRTRQIGKALGLAFAGEVTRRSFFNDGSPNRFLKEVTNNIKQQIRVDARYGKDSQKFASSLSTLGLSDTDQVGYFVKEYNKSARESAPVGVKFLNKMLSTTGEDSGAIFHPTRQRIIDNGDRKIVLSGEQSLVDDRGIVQLRGGRKYDLSMFNIDKIRDRAAKWMERVSIGGIQPFRILLSSTNPVQTDFGKMLYGTFKPLNVVSPEIEYKVNEFHKRSKNITDPWERAKKAVMSLAPSSRMSDEEADAFLTGVMGNIGRRDRNSWAKDYYENLQYGVMGIGTSDSIHIDSSGIMHLVTNNKAFELFSGKKIGAFSQDNKTAFSQTIANITGNKVGPDGKLYGVESLRRKTPDEIVSERLGLGYSEQESWGFIDEMREQYDLGGGGVKSVFSLISGYFKKFRDPSVMNLLSVDNIQDTVNGLKRGDLSRIRGIYNILSRDINIFSSKVHNKLLGTGEDYRRFIRELSIEGPSIRGKEQSYTLSELTLSGVGSIKEAELRINRFLDIVHDGKNEISEINTITNSLIGLKSKLKEVTTVDQILNAKSPHGGTIGDLYESSLLNTYIKMASGEPEETAQLVFKSMKQIYPNSKMAHIEAYNLITKTQLHNNTFRNITDLDAFQQEKLIHEYAEELGNNIENLSPEARKLIVDNLSVNKYIGSSSFDPMKFPKHQTDTLYVATRSGSFTPKYDKEGFLTNSVGIGGIMGTNAIETFNKALGLIGLGITEYKGSQQLLGSLIKKRIAPLGGGLMALSATDTLLDDSGLFEGTPLQDGLFMLPMHAYAGMRLASQGILDATGVTEIAKYMEDLMPGSIDSPLSGFVRGLGPLIVGSGIGYAQGGSRGGIMGGIIGGAVGTLIGGGPLGFFGEYNISKSRAEILAELKGEKEVMIKKGRFWELSSGNFFGEQIEMFRPHMYHLMRSDYKDTPDYKTSVFDEIQSYIDPAVFNRRHYYSRPSLEHPGMLSNIPIIGPAIGLGSTPAHTEYYNVEQETTIRREIRDQIAFPRETESGGLASQGISGFEASNPIEQSFFRDPRSSSSIESRFQKSLYNMKEVAGLRGFTFETLQEMATGNTQAFSDTPEIEAPNIGSMTRQFYDMSMGGLLGLNEGIRRILPRDPAEIERYNPVRNLTPNWLPGFGDYYINFQHGDPFSKVSMGEARLPGAGLETLRDIRHTTPGVADLLGTDPDEAIGYYSGDVEVLVPRYTWSDKIKQQKEAILNNIMTLGSLVKERSMMYDVGRNITAYVDATIETDSGELLPVKFVPYLSKQGGFLQGSASSLNAYLVLANASKGLLIGIDETGETTQALIYKDQEKYEEEANRDYQIRQQAYDVMMQRREKGLPTAAGNTYSHIDRLRILADVAEYSNNFKEELKIVKAQIRNGILGVEAEQELETILEQVAIKKKKYDFLEPRFSDQGEALTEQARLRQEEIRDKYNPVERAIGYAWEEFIQIRNPIISKLVGKRTALTAYEQDVVYGQGFKSWQNPIDSFVSPFVNQMAVETNPIQAGLSGSTAGLIFGGIPGAVAGGLLGASWSLTGAQAVNQSGWIPEDVRTMRQIMSASDIAERDRYQMMYQMTGLSKYKWKERNTIASHLENTETLTLDRIQMLANKPERQYIQGILDNLNTNNITAVRKILPGDLMALVDKGMGNMQYTNAEAYSGQYAMAQEDIQNTSIPIEYATIKTIQKEGLDAHDVGLGWYKTMRRMKSMEEFGISIRPFEKTNRTNNNTLHPGTVKQVLHSTLKEYSPTIVIESGDGPLEIIIRGR